MFDKLTEPRTRLGFKKISYDSVQFGTWYFTRRQWRARERGKSTLMWESRLLTKLTCNWIVLGYRCYRKGHDQRLERIIRTPRKERVIVGPGHSKLVTVPGQTIYQFYTCRCCGKYFGMTTQDVDPES